MKYYFLLLSLTLTLQSSIAQDYINAIRVEVQNWSKQPLSGVQVQLFQDDSVLYTQYTDTSGIVILHHALDTLHKYSIQALDSARHFQPNHKIPLEVNYNDSLRAFEKIDFWFRMQLGGCTLYGNDRSIITFESFSTQEIIKNDTDIIKALMDEYPDMCIRFHQQKLVDESHSLAKKRQKVLFKILKQADIDMNRITFDKEIQNLNPEDHRNAHPKFEYSISSMDGKCN
jgi:hypothetical protein